MKKFFLCLILAIAGTGPRAFAQSVTITGFGGTTSDWLVVHQDATNDTMYSFVEYLAVASSTYSGYTDTTNIISAMSFTDSIAVPMGFDSINFSVRVHFHVPGQGNTVGPWQTHFVPPAMSAPSAAVTDTTVGIGTFAIAFDLFTGHDDCLATLEFANNANFTQGVFTDFQMYPDGTISGNLSLSGLPSGFHYVRLVNENQIAQVIVWTATVVIPTTAQSEPTVSNLSGNPTSSSIDWSLDWDMDNCTTGGFVYFLQGESANIAGATLVGSNYYASGSGTNGFTVSVNPSTNYWGFAVIQTLCGSDTISVMVTTPPSNVIAPVLFLDEGTDSIYNNGLDSVTINGSYMSGNDVLNLWYEVDDNIGFSTPDSYSFGTYTGQGFIHVSLIGLVPGTYYLRLGGTNSGFIAYSNVYVFSVGISTEVQQIENVQLETDYNVYSIGGVLVCKQLYASGNIQQVRNQLIQTNLPAGIYLIRHKGKTDKFVISR